MLSLRARLRRFKHNVLLRQPTDGKVRLHLGCGQDHWPGWVNVDAGPTALCDLRADFTQVPDLYPDNSVSEIAMIHSLSYLPLWQARELLRGLYGLLEPGGRLVIELPDLAKCARKVVDGEGNLPEYLEALRGLYAFGIEHMEQREHYTPYAFGWSAWHLAQELQEAGFRQLEVEAPQTHGPRLWRDTRIAATK